MDQPPGTIANIVSHVQGSVVRIVVVHPQSDAAEKKASAEADQPGAMTSIGSGFVIDPGGLIATNKHVVANAQAIFVGTPDGGRYRASIVGETGKADIALLRIKPKSALPAVTFGSSDAVRVGDTVIAIGSPFGFDNSVTAGIVSSVNRNIMEGPFDDYIQTDAAINHGNSGGALFNLQGQLVGMTSVLFAPGDYSGSAGVNFAIPSDDLRFVYDRMRQYDGFTRAGMLPIKTQQVTGLIAEAIGAPRPGGALVIELEQRSERMHGAIQPGDIIDSFNGASVTDPRDFARMAAKAPIGSDAHLELYRQGKRVDADVPILPLDADRSPPPEPAPPPKTLGLGFAQAASVPGGVLIATIDHDGSAADSGLKPGDTVVMVQQTPVSSPDQAAQALQARAASGQHFAALLIERDKQRSWIPVALPD